jgi:hypothetical protein
MPRRGFAFNDTPPGPVTAVICPADVPGMVEEGVEGQSFAVWIDSRQVGSAVGLKVVTVRGCGSAGLAGASLFGGQLPCFGTHLAAPV